MCYQSDKNILKTVNMKKERTSRTPFFLAFVYNIFYYMALKDPAF